MNTVLMPARNKRAYRNLCEGIKDGINMDGLATKSVLMPSQAQLVRHTESYKRVSKDLTTYASQRSLLR